MLPFAAGEPAMAAAAPLTMDYSTGSFADFIAGGDDVPGPGLPATAFARAEPVAARAPEAAPPAPKPAPPTPKPAPPRVEGKR
jgi:hypothetical protein